jgi:hypothetical protein
MSILLGICNYNINNYHINCNDKNNMDGHLGKHLNFCIYTKKRFLGMLIFL